MNGVEILSTQEVEIEYDFNSTAFCIAFGIVCFIFIIYGIYQSIKFYDWIGYYIVLGLILGIAIGLLVGTTFGTPSKYETQYKVAVSDEVLMNEFNEKYEIVEQEGKIYTVRERH